MPNLLRPTLLCFGLLAVQPLPAALARDLQPDDLYRLQTVSDPQLSPDGRWIAYVVSTPSRERDADESDLWIVGWDGGAPRRLTYTTASEHSPRWSADGRQIAFLSDRDEATHAGRRAGTDLGDGPSPAARRSSARGSKVRSAASPGRRTGSAGRSAQRYRWRRRLHRRPTSLRRSSSIDCSSSATSTATSARNVPSCI